MNQANLIVARIERARQDRGISVAELARRINVDRKRLWYVLNGQRSMHVDEFVRLCAVMDMSLACFLTKEQASDLAETRRRMAEEAAKSCSGCCVHGTGLLLWCGGDQLVRSSVSSRSCRAYFLYVALGLELLQDALYCPLAHGRIGVQYFSLACACDERIEVFPYRVLVRPT